MKVITGIISWNRPQPLPYLLQFFSYKSPYHRNLIWATDNVLNESLGKQQSRLDDNIKRDFRELDFQDEIVSTKRFDDPKGRAV